MIAKCLLRHIIHQMGREQSDVVLMYKLVRSAI